MRPVHYVLLLFCCSLFACSPCAQLQQRDQNLQAAFEKLQEQKWPETAPKYKVKVKTLYKKEQELLKQVRSCQIDNPEDYKYWYGERLKYPSAIEKTWFRLFGEEQQQQQRQRQKVKKGD